MSNDKTLAAPVTDEDINLASILIHKVIGNWCSIKNELIREVFEQFAAGREGWHRAILAECATIGACYQESDPAKTVRDLIEYHRKDAVWHHEQESAGRVAASTAPETTKVEIELPDGDLRKARVVYSTYKGEVLHLCAVIDAAMAAKDAS